LNGFVPAAGKKIRSKAGQLKTGSVFPGGVVDSDVPEIAVAYLVETEGDDHLRNRTVQPGQIFQEVAALVRGVFPVDQVGGGIVENASVVFSCGIVLGIVGVVIAGGVGRDSRLHHQRDHVLRGAPFRVVDITGDPRALDDRTVDVFDLARTVHFRDHVVHIRHHRHRRRDRQPLLLRRRIVDPVHFRVRRVPHDRAENKRNNVVCLDVLQRVDFRHHVILCVILDETDFPGLFGNGSRRLTRRIEAFQRADRSEKRRCKSRRLPYFVHTNSWFGLKRGGYFPFRVFSYTVTADSSRSVRGLFDLR